MADWPDQVTPEVLDAAGTYAQAVFDAPWDDFFPVLWLGRAGSQVPVWGAEGTPDPLNPWSLLTEAGFEPVGWPLPRNNAELEVLVRAEGDPIQRVVYLFEDMPGRPGNLNYGLRLHDFALTDELGFVRFNGLTPATTYTALSLDTEGIFDPAIKGGLQPEMRLRPFGELKATFGDPGYAKTGNWVQRVVTPTTDIRGTVQVELQGVFEAGSTVTVGGLAATDVVIDGDSMTFFPPAQPLGTYDLVVTGPTTTEEVRDAITYEDLLSDAMLAYGTPRHWFDISKETLVDAQPVGVLQDFGSWNDSLEQATAARQPVYSEAENAVVFDAASNHFLRTGYNGVLSSGSTTVVVFAPDSTNTAHIFFDSSFSSYRQVLQPGSSGGVNVWQGSTYYPGATNNPSGVYGVYVLVHNASSNTIDIYRNGVLLGSGGVGSQNAAGFTLGGRYTGEAGRAADIRFRELARFAGMMASDDVVELSERLMAKWGIS